MPLLLQPAFFQVESTDADESGSRTTFPVQPSPFEVTVILQELAALKEERVLLYLLKIDVPSISPLCSSLDRVSLGQIVLKAKIATLRTKLPRICSAPEPFEATIRIGVVGIGVGRVTVKVCDSGEVGRGHQSWF